MTKVVPVLIELREAIEGCYGRRIFDHEERHLAQRLVSEFRQWLENHQMLPSVALWLSRNTSETYALTARAGNHSHVTSPTTILRPSFHIVTEESNHDAADTNCQQSSLASYEENKDENVPVRRMMSSGNAYPCNCLLQFKNGLPSAMIAGWRAGLSTLCFDISDELDPYVERGNEIISMIEDPRTATNLEIVCNEIMPNLLSLITCVLLFVN